MSKAFPSNTTLNNINATVISNYNAAFQAMKKQSDSLINVISVDDSYPTMVALAALGDLTLWQGSNITESEKLARCMKPFTTQWYTKTFGIDRADVQNDARTANFAQIPAMIGQLAASHDDVLAAQCLEGGYSNDKTLWGTQILRSTPHFYDDGGIELISATHNDSGTNQSNMVSGSSGFTKELLSEACDKMRSFTNDKGDCLGIEPYALVYHPAKTAEVANMTEVRYAAPAGSTTANLENVNIYVNGTAVPKPLAKLKNSRAMWLLGRPAGININPITIANTIAPQILPEIDPSMVNYIYNKELRWHVERKTGYAFPLWQCVVRITA